MNWKERKERLIELLDTSLGNIEDNPIYEQYSSRNIVNYLTAIKQVNEIMKGDGE